MKQLVSAIVFFVVGFVAGGSNAALAADPHDIIGGLIGLGILHEIIHNDDDGHRHYQRPIVRGPYRNNDWYANRNRAWSRRPFDGRRYEGDWFEANPYKNICNQRHTTCKNQNGQTIIIIER